VTEYWLGLSIVPWLGATEVNGGSAVPVDVGVGSADVAAGVLDDVVVAEVDTMVESTVVARVSPRASVE